MANVLGQASGKDWSIYHSDCVDFLENLPENSLHFSIFSPPFASLYVYSDSERDMGNATGMGDFIKHYDFFARNLIRAIKPGRLVAVHCMNLPTSKVMDGYIGLKDLRGHLVRTFEDNGFYWHSEIVIWKDPVTQMQRTKAIGLLHKQLTKDSTISRQGLPDYVVVFRKPGANEDPVAGKLTEYHGDGHGVDESDSIGIWQRYASPVWMDINPSDTLQYRSARDNNDERHICPLQLDVIRRCLQLWTNPGDVVYDPFTGIGSTGHVCLEMGRKFIGTELKKSYFDCAVNNLTKSEAEKGGQFVLELGV
jgi:DNA modification methylase